MEYRNSANASISFLSVKFLRATVITVSSVIGVGKTGPRSTLIGLFFILICPYVPCSGKVRIYIVCSAEND
ncbi:MAG: hypothetical protein V8Q06_06955 [Acutalibacteraceae bacterium]|nr:hypothetical protein [Ruminococcus sp.]MBS6451928.1 hypothetical protein [Ruminococcus sp.]